MAPKCGVVDDYSMSERSPVDISSPRNPEARRLRALEGDRARREQEGVLIAWGLHLLAEALAAGATIRAAYAGPRMEESGEGRDLLKALRASGLRPRRATTRVLDSIADGSGDQGILLVVARHPREPRAVLDAGFRLVVGLHGVQDPGNLGGILRSSWTLGADAAVAFEGCADPFGSRVVRAAMGAHFRLPIGCGRAADWAARAAAAGLRLVAADAGAGMEPERLDLAAPTLLLLGGEGGGLPPDLLNQAAARVRIPMAPGASSLNVHAAAAVLLYEAARQRGRDPASPARGTRA